jgi:hypothetical protein
MKRDGTVLAAVPGTGVASQHAVGAYVVVSGAGKASSVDARGHINTVATSAVKLFATYPYSPPLIVDSSTAIVGCVTSSRGCSTVRVDLATGAVHTLLTVPALTGQAAMRPPGTSLVLLDISLDSRTAWLERVSPDGGRLDAVGVDIQSGAVTTHGLPSSIDDPDLAISRDGKSVAGQEDAGTNSANLAVAHLHVISMVTGADSDVQGAAPYVRGWPPPGAPTVVFSPDGISVAWWGGYENGDTDNRINLTTVGGTGRALFKLDDTVLAHGWMSAVYWLDATTLVVQVESKAPFLVDTTTGTMRSLPAGMTTLDAVLF